MRVAAISDIHGNLPALEAVLADVEHEGVDGIVVAGDTASGPWPLEVVDLLAAAHARVVRGNADRLLLEGEEGALGSWSAGRLGPEGRAIVADWPLALEVEVDGLGHVLVCHSTPTLDDAVYTLITPDEDVIELLGRVVADVVVCGHTHMQYDRELSSGLRVVNPGSVGLPYEGRRGAFWALLGPDVELRRSEYDVDAAVAAIHDLGAPVGERLLRYLVDPPDPDDVAAHFESLRGP